MQQSTLLPQDCSGLYGAYKRSRDEEKLSIFSQILHSKICFKGMNLGLTDLKKGIPVYLTRHLPKVDVTFFLLVYEVLSTSQLSFPNMFT